MIKNRIVLGVVASVLSLTLFQQPAFATGKINATPGSVTLVPGQSVQVSFALDEPIICQGSPCNVVLDFSASQSQGVTVSPSVLTWNNTEWAQPRLMVVTLSAQTPATQSQTVTLSATADSNSVYYDNFIETVAVSLVIPPAPSPSPSATPIPSENNALVRTGSIAESALLIGTGALVGGLGFVAYRRVSKRSL